MYCCKATLYKVNRLGSAVANQNAALWFCVPLRSNGQLACDRLHNIAIKSCACTTKTMSPDLSPRGDWGLGTRLKCSQRGPKFQKFLGVGGGGGEDMLPDPLEMVVFCHKIGSCFPPPPPPSKILYETLVPSVASGTLFIVPLILIPLLWRVQSKGSWTSLYKFFPWLHIYAVNKYMHESEGFICFTLPPPPLHRPSQKLAIPLESKHHSSDIGSLLR